MDIPNQPRFRHGEPLSGRDLRRVSEKANRTEGLTGPGTAFGPQGISLPFPDNPPRIRARLTSRNDSMGGSLPEWAYGWVEVEMTGLATWQDRPFGLSSNVNEMPAIEANRNKDVPNDADDGNGAIVWLDRNGPLSDVTGSRLWTFDYAAQDGFPAKIVGGSPAGYEWEEQEYSAGGNYSTLAGGRSGTASVKPAFEANDHTVAIDTVVWMRVAYDPDPEDEILREYEFNYEPTATENPPVIVVNVTNINLIDGPTYNITYINEYNSSYTQNIFLSNGVILVYCPCDVIVPASGSGSGSGGGGGGGGGGGTCETDPIPCEPCVGRTPESWAFTVPETWTGIPAVFQGDWTLLQSGACTWTRTKGNGARATLILTATTLTVHFFWVDIDIAYYVVYSATVSGVDCCLAVETTYLERNTGGTVSEMLTVTPFCCEAAGGIVTACCPDDPTPPALYATFSSSSEACAEGKTVQLDYNGSYWYGFNLGECNPPAVSGLGMGLVCDGGVWKTYAVASLCTPTGGQTLTLLNCSPLHLQGTVTYDGVYCNGTVTVDIVE